MSRDAFSSDPRGEHEPGAARTRGRSRSRSDRSSRQNEAAAFDQGNRQAREHPGVAQRKPEALDSPQAHYVGDRAYFVRDSELQTLAEVGIFRAIAASDLARFGYGGDAQRMEREVRRLRQQALLSERVVPAGRNKTLRLLALTKRGERLLRNSGRIPDDQAIYHGFAKPREAKHDADLYRLCHMQAESIARSGGRPTRVVLDYELKSRLNRDLAALPAEEQTEQARERIAERHGLSVVDGKIPLPDMRVEYDTADMEHQHLDLELATRDYRPRALAEKAKAGFYLFARSEDATRLRRVLDEREITAEILSL